MIWKRWISTFFPPKKLSRLRKTKNALDKRKVCFSFTISNEIGLCHTSLRDDRMFGHLMGPLRRVPFGWNNIACLSLLSLPREVRMRCWRLNWLYGALQAPMCRALAHSLTLVFPSALTNWFVFHYFLSCFCAKVNFNNCGTNTTVALLSMDKID